ncbi:hypothetical protein VULLAG_LOCUS13950 [Vulpes lagopus]
MGDEIQLGLCLVPPWGQGHLQEEGHLVGLPASQAAILPASGGNRAAQTPEPLAPGPWCVLLREIRGHCGWKTPGHLDPQALAVHCSLGIQGNQKSAGDSVYFQMTFFKKNSLPQMLDPECGMWSCKQLSPPQTLHSSLFVGRGPGGILGDTGRTWPGLASWIWALFLVSLCPRQDADTPPPPHPLTAAPAGTACLG